VIMWPSPSEPSLNAAGFCRFWPGFSVSETKKLRRLFLYACARALRGRSLQGVRMTRWLRVATAIAFVAAYVVCEAVQPESTVSDTSADTALALAGLAALIAAVIALLAGAQAAPALCVVNGIGMLAQTFIYPGGYPDTLGWWFWVQAALSLGVLATSILILMAERFKRPVERAFPHDIPDDAPSPEQVRLDVQPVVRDDAIAPRHDAVDED
jgi:hypothetical protein